VIRVPSAAEFPRDASRPDRLGVADIEIAVGLGREARHHGAGKPAGEMAVMMSRMKS
jgi:hypothetical protein